MSNNIFVELTHKYHGGEGWELGNFLWSPVGSTWNNIMTQPKKGDYVIHSIKTSTSQHFCGYSVVESSYKITNEKPISDDWKNRNEYYKIPLKGFTKIDLKKVQTFLNDYRKDLDKIALQKSFYNEKDGKYRTAQGKYLSKVSPELFDLVADYLNISTTSFEDLKLLDASTVEEEIKSSDKDGKPNKISVTTQRIVRNTKIVRELKNLYSSKCQVCGKVITFPSSNKYSEGHHLKQLGGIHQGPDIKENILILCSNHHVEFDYGVIAIDPTSKKIVHIDTTNEFHNKSLNYQRSDLDKDFIEYHFEVIFNKS